MARDGVKNFSAHSIGDFATQFYSLQQNKKLSKHLASILEFIRLKYYSTDKIET